MRSATSRSIWLVRLCCGQNMCPCYLHQQSTRKQAQDCSGSLFINETGSRSGDAEPRHCTVNSAGDTFSSAHQLCYASSTSTFTDQPHLSSKILPAYKVWYEYKMKRAFTLLLLKTFKYDKFLQSRFVKHQRLSWHGSPIALFFPLFQSSNGASGLPKLLYTPLNHS